MGLGEVEDFVHSSTSHDIPTFLRWICNPVCFFRAAVPTVPLLSISLMSSLTESLAGFSSLGLGIWTQLSAILRPSICPFFSEISPRLPRPSRPPKSPVPRNVRSRFRVLCCLWAHRDPHDISTSTALQQERNSLLKLVRRSLRSRAREMEAQQLHGNVQAFRHDRYGFSRGLFHPRVQVTPASSKDTADAHFSSFYAHADRVYVYEDRPDLPQAPSPTHPFASDVPTLAQLLQVLKRCRNSSAPGPNRISYLVYKHLTSVQRHLHAIFCRVWSEQYVPYVPQAWRVASMILLPKSEDACHPSLMRNIALSNVEGKLFFSLVGGRLQAYMLDNRYFDGSAQKGFLPGV
jgi:hypothetical protein